MAIKLGKRVKYTDGDGYEKLAFVTGTRDSVRKDGTAVRPDKNAANLLVVSPTGKQYHRENIPAGAGPRTFSSI